MSYNFTKEVQKVERIMKKPELTDELAARTGFYKKNMKEVVDALSDIVEEHFQTAEFGADSELHLAPGVLICGERKPEQESIDPRNREKIITPEKVLPYAVFKQSIRKKLYVQSKKKTRKDNMYE
jgi:nucleoid DNA-binding protein